MFEMPLRGADGGRGQNAFPLLLGKKCLGAEARLSQATPRRRARSAWRLSPTAEGSNLCASSRESECVRTLCRAHPCPAASCDTVYSSWNCQLFLISLSDVPTSSAGVSM